MTKLTSNDGFEAFWSAYPARRPNPKAEARRHWLNLVKSGIAPELLQKAAENYAREVAFQGLEPQFIPHARTWLRQRRFEDYLQSAAPAPALAPSHPKAETTPRGEPIAFDRLQGQVEESEFRKWLAPCRVMLRQGELTVIAPSGFIRDKAHRWAAALAAAYGASRVTFQ